MVTVDRVACRLELFLVMSYVACGRGRRGFGGGQGMGRDVRKVGGNGCATSDKAEADSSCALRVAVRLCKGSPKSKDGEFDDGVLNSGIHIRRQTRRR